MNSYVKRISAAALIAPTVALAGCSKKAEPFGFVYEGNGKPPIVVPTIQGFETSDYEVLQRTDDKTPRTGTFVTAAVLRNKKTNDLGFYLGATKRGLVEGDDLGLEFASPVVTTLNGCIEIPIDVQAVAVDEDRDWGGTFFVGGVPQEKVAEFLGANITWREDGKVATTGVSLDGPLVSCDVAPPQENPTTTTALAI